MATTAGPAATDAHLKVLHERVPGAPVQEVGLDAAVAWVAATYPGHRPRQPADLPRLRQHRRRLVTRPHSPPLPNPPALAPLGVRARRGPWSTIPTIT